MRRVESRRPRAFSLPELIVVIGVIALLMALIVPPLIVARRQAMRTQCMARLQQIGLALEAARFDYGFYPLWDDGRDLVRYTWIDVLIQRRFFADYRGGYCPEDLRPDPLNEARGRAYRVYYPGTGLSRRGIDYSYGIGMPLSAGGWKWMPGYDGAPPDRSFRFDGHELNPAGRVLAGDGNWSYLYNLSGAGMLSGIWNDPQWFDNTVAYRHGELSANILLQDGHVDRLSYHPYAEEPVNTVRQYVWYPGEPLHVGPDSRNGIYWYPNAPPPRFDSTPPGDVYPNDLNPAYYSAKRLWTLIEHK